GGHRLGLVQRRVQRGHRGLASAQALSQLRPEFLVLLDQPVKLDLDLVEEGVDFFLVVSGPEPGGTELLVPHIRGRQRHLFSSARLECVPYGTVPDQSSCTALIRRRTMKNSNMKLRSRATLPSRRTGMNRHKNIMSVEEAG